MWTTTAKCAAVRCAFFSQKMTVKSWEQRTVWEKTGLMGKALEIMPDILVVPNFYMPMPLLRVFAENAFGCLQKQKLSLISKNPAARSLVDGKLNKQVNTHTHMKIAILTLIAASAVLSACQQPAPPPPPPPMHHGK